MKALVVLLVAGSLALNVVLAGLWWAGRPRADAPDATRRPVVANTAATVTGPVEQAWTDLKSDDLPAMVEQLRASGFPPHIVRAIAAGRLREVYRARYRALDPQAESRPFWLNPTVDAKLMQQQRQLYREEQNALRHLLGPGDDSTDVNALYQGRRFDSVPPEKVDDVRRTLREFDDRRQDIFGAGGTIGSEQGRRLNALDREQRDALAAILTPQELEDYQLRNSDTARNLRNQLSAFDPTEEEFRTLHKLQSEFESQHGRMFGMPSPEEQQRRSAAQRQLNEQIKATLGPVRGAEYERANDFFFRQASQLVSRLELPPQTTNQLWSVKQEIEQRAMTIRRDQSMPMPERTKQLAALADEAATKVAPLLGGPRGLEAYRQNGGSWMQSLTPRTSDAPVGTTRILTTPGR